MIKNKVFKTQHKHLAFPKFFQRLAKLALSNTHMNYAGRDLNLSSKQLQSWTKSVIKNLALSYPQDTHYTGASSLNPPSLGAKMIQSGFNIILGRKGEFFAVGLQRAVFLIHLVTYIFVVAPCIILLSVGHV